jgi:hypothetical protein
LQDLNLDFGFENKPSGNPDVGFSLLNPYTIRRLGTNFD